jgi:hypothetical protein
LSKASGRTDVGRSSYEIVAMNMNGHQQRFRAAVTIDSRPSTGDQGGPGSTLPFLMIEGKPSSADATAEMRDNHLDALARWIEEE